MKQEQLAYQRQAYDSHYPKMAEAIAEQMAHPLLSAFYDRLATRILDHGVPEGRGTADAPVRLFEAGCGEGLVAAAVQRVADRRGLVYSYTGTDLSPAGVELARTYLKGELRHGDAVELVAGLAPGSQDLIWVKNLLHHLDDPAELVRHAVRAVGPTGRVVIVEPRLWCPVHWVNLMWFRQERHLFKGYRRTLAAFRAARAEVLHSEMFSWLPYELAFAVRFKTLRQLFDTADPAELERASAFDEKLTDRMPGLSLYVVTTLVGAAGPVSANGSTNNV